jgi:UDP-N-acetylmuramate: L-alanyl-gamma-D-glutamyl-meso-diaminopimelate ligase
MQNIQGALVICRELGVEDHQFYDAIQTFKGADRRQQLLASGKNRSVYLDFAHAPSKVSATVNAFREANQDQTLIACLELYTESSLNMEFLPQYAGTLEEADHAMVYFNPKEVKRKGLPPLSPEQIKKQFGRNDLTVYNDSDQLERALRAMKEPNCVVLLMTSGNFSGIDLHRLAEDIVQP